VRFRFAWLRLLPQLREEITPSALRTIAPELADDSNPASTLHDWLDSLTLQPTRTTTDNSLLLFTEKRGRSSFLHRLRLAAIYNSLTGDIQTICLTTPKP
jgi:hypothetical protein